MIKVVEGVTMKTLLFTLMQIIIVVRRALIEDYGLSENKANMAILLAVDAEKKFNESELGKTLTKEEQS